MSLVPLADLPDDARVWCFGADPEPGPDTAGRLLEEMRAFVSEWTAHRKALRAGVAWRSDRFLCVAVDESAAGASGCSIDALSDRLRELERELGVSLLDAAPVWYRDAAGTVRSVSRETFRALAARGEIGADTPAFDLTVATLGELRAGRLERPVRESWHARLL
jgi:hypothetical protein